MIDYSPFWKTLNNSKETTYTLRENYNVSPKTLTKMRHNQYLSLRTIEDLCKILDCDIDDIVRYISKNK
jgi:putative transcriptional regulator